jgi:hypothetical protein
MNTTTRAAITVRKIPDIPDSPMKGWTKINNAAIAMLPKIGLTAFAVYVVIAKHVNRAGVAWPCMNTIARLAGVTVRTARRAVFTLQAKGLIRVERRKDSSGRDQSSRYILSPIRESDTNAPPVVLPCQGEGDTNDRGRVTQTTHEQDLIEQDTSNKTSSCRKLRFDEADRDTADWIFRLIRAMAPNHKEPNIDQWANDIRLMRQQDKRPDADIRATFLWANADSFWRTNVLSPAKLRKQFDQLSLKMNGDHRGNGRQRASAIGPGQRFDPNAPKAAKF